MRTALHRHIDYFETRPHALLGPIRTNLVADPQVREVFDEARWAGALSFLHLANIDEPTTGTQLVMRAWLAYHDDLLSRWLVDRGFDRDRIVDVLYLSLITALDSVHILEPETHLDLSALHQ